MSNFNNTSNQNNNIYSKPCVYNCGTLQLFFGILQLMSIGKYPQRRKHICPNRVNKPVSVNTANSVATTIINSKPTYYSKKP